MAAEPLALGNGGAGGGMLLRVRATLSGTSKTRQMSSQIVAPGAIAFLPVYGEAIVNAREANGRSGESMIRCLRLRLRSSSMNASCVTR